LKLQAKDTILAFAADQLAHLAVVIAIALSLPGLAAEGLWSLLPGDEQAIYYVALVFASGIVVAVPMGGIVIKKLIKPLVPTDGAVNTAVPKTNARRKTAPPVYAESLPTIGRYIGWLERGLTFAFIIARQPEGVGFLLAAKSVLRIGDLRDEHDRSHAEYIIIGTFLSFGWGMVAAYVTMVAASHWVALG
jgi:hypothetical protein